MKNVAGKTSQIWLKGFQSHKLDPHYSYTFSHWHGSRHDTCGHVTSDTGTSCLVSQGEIWQELWPMCFTPFNQCWSTFPTLFCEKLSWEWSCRQTRAHVESIYSSQFTSHVCFWTLGGSWRTHRTQADTGRTYNIWKGPRSGSNPQPS